MKEKTHLGGGLSGAGLPEEGSGPLAKTEGLMVAAEPEAESVPVTGDAPGFALPEAPAGAGDPPAALPRFVQPAAFAASKLFACSLQKETEGISRRENTLVSWDELT